MYIWPFIGQQELKGVSFIMMKLVFLKKLLEKEIKIYAKKKKKKEKGKAE